MEHRVGSCYGFYEAKTTFGRIGVKVWIYKGDLTAKELAAQQATQQRGPRQGGPGRRGPRQDAAVAAGSES